MLGPRALGRRASAPLQGGQHREARRRRARPVRDAVRHPDDRVRPGQGLPPERPPRAAAGRVQPPRPRRARRGRQPPRDRAPARDPRSAWARTRSARATTRPRPELLEAADRMGFLVMDEAFDMWGKTKVKNGHGKYFAEWGERDLRDMIRRDRNHPSVVMWSIGNEILEQADADGWKVAKRLTDICHEEDPTRPVTAGFNQVENAIRNRLADQVDIPGFNYGVREYAKILAEHPGWTIVGAETASCVSSRGRLPPADREVREAPVAPAHELRRDRAALGVLPGRRVRRARGLAAGARRVRVDGLRLPRRADAVLRVGPAAGREGLARAQLLLRDRGPRRVPEGPLLPLPEPVDDGADGAPAARTGTGPGARGSPSR